MATLIFTSLGTTIGGPLGGAVGAIVGGQVDNAVFGGVGQGPRLSDLAVTASSYGSAIPQHFGQMRVPGSIIWATNLVEHKHTQGGGKGSPSVTAYGYTVSFAVALSSRPLLRLGRVWADGGLLRGAAGDMKVGGRLRFYPGSGAQAQDSLIASAEGAGRCPAFRGIAYVVFEDLDLANFGNRIPAMTFEVFADDGALTLAPLLARMARPVVADGVLPGVAGYSSEGAYAATLAALQQVMPMSVVADGLELRVSPEDGAAMPVALREAAVADGPGEVGGRGGMVRKRAPMPADPPLVLRYYDRDRDYLPGVQRAPGQAGAGAPRTVQLPAALTAGNALALVTRAAHDADWARETILWRTSELDPAVGPGVLVTVPGHRGVWRVSDWEWRAGGVELTLVRVAPAARGVGVAASAGAAPGAADVAMGATALVAFELPYDGMAGTVPQVMAACAAEAGGWAGATLYSEDSAGALTAVAVAGRTASTMGVAASVLAASSPLLFDRSGTVMVRLLSPAMGLTDATTAQLLAGANRALLGAELIQFGRAEALGEGVWRLGGLVRGRGGTEAAVAAHAIGEPFVLLDGALTAVTLPGGSAADVHLAAIGLADAEPVTAAIINAGISLTPPAPVHLAATATGDGGIALRWVRRARGIWGWSDGVDVPLVEQAERYHVGFGALDAPVARWTVETPALAIDAAGATALRAAGGGLRFWVRQAGTYALSAPAWVDVPAVG